MPLIREDDERDPDKNSRAPDKGKSELRGRTGRPIGERAGVPGGVDQWQWSCGFYLGMEPGEYVYGTAADFFTARRNFEIAWREFSARKTEADYREWRDYRDLIARKPIVLGSRKAADTKGSPII